MGGLGLDLVVSGLLARGPPSQHGVLAALLRLSVKTGSQGQRWGTGEAGRVRLEGKWGN